MNYCMSFIKSFVKTTFEVNRLTFDNFCLVLFPPKHPSITQTGEKKRRTEETYCTAVSCLSRAYSAVKLLKTRVNSNSRSHDFGAVL